MIHDGRAVVSCSKSPVCKQSNMAEYIYGIDLSIDYRYNKEHEHELEEDEHEAFLGLENTPEWLCGYESVDLSG
jgi:hypothetical protein